MLILVGQRIYKYCNIAIWLFFFLLIFEGAFRKWFLPSLSDLFLVIRDPLAIYLVWVACKRGLWKNLFVRVSWGIAFITLITTLLFGHQNLLLALYGVRIWVYYIPLIFSIPLFMNLKDVMSMCKCTLYITMGMTLLMLLQYFTPQTSFFNVGVGGEGSSGFSGVGDYFRPSGTFSFTNGIALYMVWAGCSFFACFFSNRKWEKRKFWVSPYILWASFVCWVVAVPVSLSRAVVAEVVIIFLWAMGLAFLTKKYKKSLFYFMAILLVLSPLLLMSQRIQIAVDNMQERFVMAGKSEGNFVTESIVERKIVSMFSDLLNSNEVPFFYGEGIGMSTNVAAVMLTGKKQFLTKEGGSDSMENGYLMGCVMFLYKWILLFYIFYRCVKVRTCTLLPLLFAVSLFLIRPGTGQTPADVGFSVWVAAMTLTLAVKSEYEIIHTRK